MNIFCFGDFVGVGVAVTVGAAVVGEEHKTFAQMNASKKKNSQRNARLFLVMNKGGRLIVSGMLGFLF